MDQHFDTIIDSYVENQVGISEFFLTEKLASELRNNLNGLFDNDLLRKAGTGNESVALVDKAIRVSIGWIVVTMMFLRINF